MANNLRVTTFLNTKFTDVLKPELVSLGLVTLDGLEHYVELDLKSEPGREGGAYGTSVPHGIVLDLQGAVPDSACTVWDMSRRTGEWVLQLVNRSGAQVDVAYDYGLDFTLFETAVRNSGLWDQVREAICPVNIDYISGTIDGGLAAEACYRSLRGRGLCRQHALADALALRAAYVGVKDVAGRLTRFTRTAEFSRLAVAFGGRCKPDALAPDVGCFDAEGWLRRWLVEEQTALDGRRPLDMLEEPGGLARLETLLLQLAAGVYV